MLDITDPKLFWPQPDEILQQFNCEENPSAQFTFRLKAISDKRLNPLMNYHLADAAATDKKNDQHDPQNRSRNISAFYGTVRQAVNNFYTHMDTGHSMQHSECYRAIVNELIFLSEYPSEQKTLLLFTDLREQSAVLNSYSEDISDPIALARRLDSAYPKLPNLKGITVIIVFSPRDRNEDKAFGNMAEAYKILLNKKGATVSVQANL